jgi:hypothetical protein
MSSKIANLLEDLSQACILIDNQRFRSIFKNAFETLNLAYQIFEILLLGD